MDRWSVTVDEREKKMKERQGGRKRREEERERERESGDVLPAAGRGGLGGEQIQTAERRSLVPRRRIERHEANFQLLLAEEVLQGQLRTVDR